VCRSIHWIGYNKSILDIFLIALVAVPGGEEAA
jgi:hypothetical protein